MKNKIILILLFNIFLKINLTFGQGTDIIGLSLNNTNTSAIIKYDYINQNYDTLFAIPGTCFWFNEESCIDFFNGRYFFGSSITGYPNHTIFSYDIPNNSLIPLFQMPIGSKQGIEYDCFTNSLIFRSDDSLECYNITTGIKSTICKIPYADCSWLISGFKRTYNYYNQQYLYIADLTGNFDYYYVLVDVLNGIVLDTTYALNSGSLLTYDLITNSYFGTKNNGIVSKINPINGTYSQSSLPPPDYEGLGLSQGASFNSTSGQYLLPYSTTNLSKFAVINVNDSIISQITNFPFETIFLKLYSKPKPLIKFHNNSIIASYASTYNWYFNNIIIAGANLQTYTPTESGYYKVKEMFYDGRIEFSDSIYCSLLAIDCNSFFSKENMFFPNPFSESTTLKLSLNYNNIELTIYNVMGIESKKIKNISGNEVKFEKENLNSGIYFYELKQGTKNISTGKLVITD